MCKQNIYYGTLTISVVFIILVIINIFPIFYFKSAEFETKDHKIKYSYKWDLFALQDVRVDRKIKITNKITGLSKSHKLLVDGEDIYEISFYTLKNGIIDKNIENSMIVKAPWLYAIFNLDNLELIDMAFEYELLNTKYKQDKLSCIGKVGRNGFVPGNCTIDDY